MADQTTTDSPFPWPNPGFAHPSPGALRAWEGLPHDYMLTDSELRALREDWRRAAKRAGYALVWLHTTTGEIASGRK